MNPISNQPPMGEFNKLVNKASEAYPDYYLITIFFNKIDQKVLRSLKDTDVVIKVYNSPTYFPSTKVAFGLIHKDIDLSELEFVDNYVRPTDFTTCNIRWKEPNLDSLDNIKDKFGDEVLGISYVS